MKSDFLKMLRREKQRLKEIGELVDDLIRNLEKNAPLEPGMLGRLYRVCHSDQEQIRYPYFGSMPDKVEFVLEGLGRFSRKETILRRLAEFQPEQDLTHIPTILSRMVADGRAVSLKYNRSNLFVFYGLPSFVDFQNGEIVKDFSPEAKELENLRVRQISISCGKECKDVVLNKGAG